VGEWWYRVTINLVTIDEEAGKEKKLRTFYLVQADDIEQALQRMEESLSFLVVPYVITSIAVSVIADVFPYHPMVRQDSGADMDDQYGSGLGIVSGTENAASDSDQG